jgi:hypothetical protein
MGRPKSKQYRIVTSFTYKGPKGNWKPPKYVRIGPGQEFPKLESSEVERLLHEGKICEVDSHGERIPNQRFIEMSAEQIDRIFSGKAELAIMNIIKSSKFSTDTLNRMLIFCERSKLNQATKFIDEILSKALSV